MGDQALFGRHYEERRAMIVREVNWDARSAPRVHGPMDQSMEGRDGTGR